MTVNPARYGAAVTTAVLAQRGLIAASLLAFLEGVAVCQTSLVPLAIFHRLLIPHLVLVTALLLPSLCLRWADRGRGRGARLADLAAVVFLILGPVLVFALRGGGEGVAVVGRPWVPWVRWGSVLAACALAGVALFKHRNSVLSHGRFLGLSFPAYALAVFGFAVRTVQSSARLPPALVERPGSTWLAVTTFWVAIVAVFLVLRAARPSWSRVAVASTVLAVIAPLTYLCHASLVARPVPLVMPAPQHPVSVKAPVRGVVLITLDTTRRDYQSPYGYRRERTPHLESLSNRSMVFDSAYASSPYTLSSHASLFTGVLPSVHGAHRRSFAKIGNQGWWRELDQPLGLEIPTLGEKLAAQGYRTAGIAANHGYLDTWTGLARGFGEYVAAPRTHIRYFPLVWPFKAMIGDAFPRAAFLESWGGDRITDAAIHWLGTIGNEPFFLFLNYLDAHEYLAEWPAHHRPKAIAPELSVGSAQKELVTRAYDQKIAFQDQEMGRLFEWMSSRRLFEESVIMVTSDHGEYLGEHELWGHDHDLHEPVLKVPLLLKGPRMKQATRCGARVTHEDMFTLLLAAAADELIDCRRAGSNGSAPRVIAEVWNLESRRRSSGRFGWNAARAVYAGDWKLIQRIGTASSLYNLASDPAEKDDLYRSQPEFAQGLASDLIAALPPLKIPEPRQGSDQIDSAAAERLRGLGYIGP